MQACCSAVGFHSTLPVCLTYVSLTCPSRVRALTGARVLRGRFHAALPCRLPYVSVPYTCLTYPQCFPYVSGGALRGRASRDVSLRVHTLFDRALRSRTLRVPKVSRKCPSTAPQPPFTRRCPSASLTRPLCVSCVSGHWQAGPRSHVMLSIRLSYVSLMRPLRVSCVSLECPGAGRRGAPRPRFGM